MLGGSDRCVPYIQQLIDTGHTVICQDKDEKAPGFDFATVKINTSIQDKETAIKYVQGMPVDACITIAQQGLETNACINNLLGLKGISKDTYELTQNKYEAKNVYKMHGIHVPKDTDTKRLEYPFLVKPLNSTGSRGVYKINDWHEQTVYSQIHPEYIGEDYIEGDHVSVDLLMQNSRMRYFLMQDRYLTYKDCFVDSIIISPSKYYNGNHFDLPAIAEEAAFALGIDDGPANVQFIIRNHIPYLIEVNPRISGPYGIECHTMATEVDWFYDMVNLAKGYNVKRRKFNIEPNVLVTIGSKEEGIIEDVIFDERYDFNRIWCWKYVGDHVNKFTTVKDSICHLFKIGGDYNYLLKQAKGILKNTKIKLRSA